jgi:hypothetical protein
MAVSDTLTRRKQQKNPKETKGKKSIELLSKTKIQDNNVLKIYILIKIASSSYDHL